MDGRDDGSRKHHLNIVQGLLEDHGAFSEGLSTLAITSEGTPTDGGHSGQSQSITN